jgi:hypothetical protein
MLPADQSRSGFISFFNELIYKAKNWIRQEIVDDDPWDTETLYPDSQNSEAQSKSTDSQNLPPSEK